MAEPLSFDFINSIIEVPYPDTTLDLQYLVNQVRDMEDELSPSMVYSKIMDAYGKQALGGGTYVGITVMLLDAWRVRFESRAPGPETIVCSITGGNLVAASGNPIAPSPYVTVTLAQSSSATIAEAEGTSAAEIADAVWDELISAHATAGSAGKALRDAKIKATLASLK